MKSANPSRNNDPDAAPDEDGPDQIPHRVAPRELEIDGADVRLDTGIGDVTASGAAREEVASDDPDYHDPVE